MSDIAGQKVPGGTEIGRDTNPAGYPKTGANHNEDLRIYVVAPVEMPYHKWLAFTSAVQAQVVTLMKRHHLIEDDGNGG